MADITTMTYPDRARYEANLPRIAATAAANSAAMREQVPSWSNPPPLATAPASYARDACDDGKLGFRVDIAIFDQKGRKREARA